MKKRFKASRFLVLSKTPTGIQGLDEITNGGLPTGRPTLIAGSAGAGKTMLALEFLVRGATQFGEPGVCMMFEENADELIANVRSLGFDLANLVRQKKIVLDFVRVERNEVEETGAYDLEGLFIRIGHAIDTIGAKRVVLDTIEALFAGLPNHAVIRAELRRLFRWLKDRGVTAVITGEKGEASITRYGLEEYVADCVITLDHRVTGQISTRRLRVVKYRGSVHGTNEYPFLIGANGFSVLPVTSLALSHAAPTERLSTGIAALDDMFGGRGIYRGASVLVSGAPGTGKSTVAATFVDAACRRGERALLFAYEESPAQITRNMRSVGLDLESWVKKGRLLIHSSRPTLYGLEQHLVQIHQAVTAFKPTVVAVDPISSLTMERDAPDVSPTLLRLIDFLKSEQITALFTNLTSNNTDATSPENSQVGVSSLMDAWVLLRNHELNGERNRTLFILKARGLAHSNQVREFVLSDRGVDLVDVYIGDEGVLTGTARLTQEARTRAVIVERREANARKLRESTSKEKLLVAQIEALQAQIEAERAERLISETEEAGQTKVSRETATVLATLRGATQKK